MRKMCWVRDGRPGAEAGSLRLLLLIFVFALFAANAAMADDDDDDGNDRNWKLLAGAGFGYAPSFTGSDIGKPEFFPLIVGEYRWPKARVHIEGDEIGGTVRLLGGFPLSASMGLSLGESRLERSDPLLEGSGDVRNYVRGLASLTVGEEILSGNVRVRYVPLTAGSGPLEHGFLYDCSLKSEIEAIPLVLQGSVGLCFMDGTYARAMYGLGDAAVSGPFAANAGFHSVDASVEAILMFCRFAGVYLGGNLSWLGGSAAESPVSENDLQAAGLIGLFYMF